jgi:hypothetical protein
MAGITAGAPTVTGIIGGIGITGITGITGMTEKNGPTASGPWGLPDVT